MDRKADRPCSLGGGEILQLSHLEQRDGWLENEPLILNLSKISCHVTPELCSSFGTLLCFPFLDCGVEFIMNHNRICPVPVIKGRHHDEEAGSVMAVSAVSPNVSTA